MSQFGPEASEIKSPPQLLFKKYGNAKLKNRLFKSTSCHTNAFKNITYLNKSF